MKHSLLDSHSSKEDPDYDEERQKVLLEFQKLDLKAKTGGGEFKFAVPQVVYPNTPPHPQFRFGVDDYESPAKVITKKKEEVVVVPDEEIVEVQPLFPVKTLAFIFSNKSGKTFVPYNCSFVYNPDDKMQSLKVEQKVVEIQTYAKENNVSFEMVAMTGVSKTSIAEIGGLTNGFTSLRFPPAASSSRWFEDSPAKATKKPNKKKSKSLEPVPPDDDAEEEEEDIE